MAAPTHSVHVANIAPTTTEQHLNEFFEFCGKITSIDFKADSKQATVHFEKPSAAKTALMLNGGTLDGSSLSVTSDVTHPDDEDNADPVSQSDKPRAAVAAEYLAKGYTLSDQILQRAIDLDSKQGISQRFLSYFHSIDSSLGSRALGPDKTISGKVQETLQAATQQAKTVDEQRGISKTANDYYTKALSSPMGQKVYDFYTSTSKQALDIHEEAKRIHASQKAAAAPSTTSTSGEQVQGGDPAAPPAAGV
ncbi:hypothetical protein K435DRAFT_650353 [Dendrothele bispora CBS 962.96]|uniref:RRM domain-containing protein n=1 Tax=Dendrothele bispora (strain CBS 962.96) TaxID=1314807 RepID=A0A4V6T5M9_DENBC|nr:hypothetical protein K435DRAFT_650353 [Dendrothele bispora CBS 962.96]